MATLKDLFNDGVDEVVKSAKSVGKATSDAFENVAQKAGLRGGGASPGIGGQADPLGAAAQNAENFRKPGTGVTPYNPVVGQAHTPGDPGKYWTTSGDPTMAEGQSPRTKADPLAGEAPKPQGLRSGNTGANPNIPKGGMSPEAAAWRATQTTAKPGEPFQPQAAKKLGLGGKLLRGAGLVAGGAQFVHGLAELKNNDPERVGKTPTANSIDNMFQGTATMMNPVVGFAGNVATGLRDAAMGAIYKARTGMDYDPEFGDGTKKKVLRGSAVQPDFSKGIEGPGGFTGRNPDGSASQVDTMIDTTRGNQVTPEQLIKGTQVPVAGQGAFQRTTPGNEGVATKVGARAGTVQPGGAEAGSKGLRLPQTNTLAGHMVNLAALNANAQAAAARESGKAAETSLGIKAATANATIAKTQADLDKQGGEQFDKEIEADVLRDPKFAGMKKEEREGAVTQRKAEVLSRMKHSTAAAGVDFNRLKPEQRRQLVLANRIRDRIESNWDNLPQQIRDYFGNNRRISDNLYGYMPKADEKGNVSFMGMTIPADKVHGGGFNFFGPNDPVDRDVFDLIKAAKAKKDK